MSETTMLVPVRYPLTASSVQTVTRAADIAADRNGAHLFVLHVNQIGTGEDVSRTELQRAVEATVGVLPDVSYHVRSAFLFEEAILEEARYHDVDCVVIGQPQRARWRHRLTVRLGVTVDLEAYLQQHLSAELTVV